MTKQDPFEGLIGTDPSLLQAIEDAGRAARTDFNVLIFGKTRVLQPFSRASFKLVE